MRRTSDIERLLGLLRHELVHRAEAVHGYDCKFPREGKRHGPCTCGAQQLDAELRQALIDCGVSFSESPNQVRERLALYRASLTDVLRGSSDNGND